MSKKGSQIEKVLNQPVAKTILQLLTKEPLSISQIYKKLQNIDIQTIIAFIVELQRFGLIIPSSKEFNKQKTNETEKDINKLDEIMQIPRHEWFSPLGLTIPEYNSLWEEVGKKKGSSYPEILNTLIFTIPDTLKEQFKNDYGSY